MNKHICILLLLILTGCAHSLKKGFSNFSAYYNTFYNAKQNFKAGLKKVQQQPVNIDANATFRVFPEPAAAGQSDFKNAIKNGNQVLRNHARSKWADNALLLVGKSHYYLGEYFVAEQKFEELLNFPLTSPLKQDAVIWKGKAQLQTKSYAKGMQFLMNALSNAIYHWKAAKKAEAKVVLAEDLAMLQQAEQAAAYLASAIDSLHGNSLKGRAYLLLGQMLQRTGHYQKAFHAYDQVASLHPSYDYIYLANLKKAETLRLSGDYARATSIYSSMLRDDKNLKRHDEMFYQLARTYQKQGKIDEAVAAYKKALRKEATGGRQQIADQTYYRLGKIYSNNYHNYALAAAYFDSSSALKGPQINDESSALAAAYKRYGSIKQEMGNIDSLLALGALSKNALHAQLLKIRRNRKQALRNSQNVVQLTNNTLSNTRSNRFEKRNKPQAGPSDFGFLGYKNPREVSRERQQFLGVFGNRPLVDNWRRKEAITGNVLNRRADSTNQTSAKTANTSLSDKQLGIDVSAIPRTPQSRKKLKQQFFEAEYRLGNLFFLNLSQPDSAQYYYHRILQEDASSGLKAQTLYSLYELNNLQGDSLKAADYKTRILRKYANTPYASRLHDRTISSGSRQQADSEAAFKAKVNQLLALRRKEKPDSSLAVRLKKLAVSHPESSLSPAVYYQGIREYIQFAKARDFTQIAADSLNTLPQNAASANSYSGKNWDTIRDWLKDYEKKFPRSPGIGQVMSWLQVLTHPAQVQPLERCKALGVKPKIIAGKKHFVQSVKLPAKVKNLNLSGHVKYRIKIAKDGSVESFKLLSNPTHLGIEQSFEQAMKKNLRFQPIEKNGHAVRASCEVSFPIEQ